MITSLYWTVYNTDVSIFNTQLNKSKTWKNQNHHLYLKKNVLKLEKKMKRVIYCAFLEQDSTLLKKLTKVVLRALLQKPSQHRPSAVPDDITYGALTCLHSIQISFD